MLTNLLRKIFYTIGLLFALVGCAALDQYVPAEPPTLTVSQQDKIGSAVESKLIQLLGGVYYDKDLSADLNRLLKPSGEGNRSFRLTVADGSAAAIYPLPGHRAIISRGLLAGIQNPSELESLLTYAEQLSNRTYRTRTSRSMVEATELVLTDADALYDPESASIRLARMFQQEACDRECLATASLGKDITSTERSPNLPESIRRLNDLQPAYALLASAREIEKSGNHGKAIATYLQAAAKAPDEPQILRALGLAYLRAGQLQPARLHLQKAVKLQPDYYRSLMGLGYLFLQEGELQKSNHLLGESVRLLATAENLFLLAEAREKAGDIKGAIALYRLVAGADQHGKLGQISASRVADAAGEQ